MGYLVLNKRQTTGIVLASVVFKDDSFIQLIKLEEPYKDGTKYSIYETTKNPYVSNRLSKSDTDAFNWFYFYFHKEIKENEVKKSYYGEEYENYKRLKENGSKSV